MKEAILMNPNPLYFTSKYSFFAIRSLPITQFSISKFIFSIVAARGGEINQLESWKQTERKCISLLVYIDMPRRADVVIGCAAALVSSDWRASL
jgi:hypothetical protein